MRDENKVKHDLIVHRSKVILLENELLEIERDLAFRDYKVKIDSVVIAEGDEYLVTAVRYKWRKQLPSLMGKKKLMGGGWAQQIKHVYGEWELKK